MTTVSRLVRRTGRAAFALVLRVGSLVAYLALYRLLGPRHLGPGSDGWDTLRTRCVRLFDRLTPSSSGQGVFQADVEPDEYAGTVEVPPEEATRLLWGAGFHRNPLSGIRSRDGDPEISSWVYRESPLSRRQIHVHLFPGEEPGTTDLYAHKEYSSVNPRVAVEHYRGSGKDVQAGVSEVRDRLSLGESTGRRDSGSP